MYFNCTHKHPCRPCVPAGDVQLAIEFLLLAGQLDQAFDLAAAKGQLDTFGQLAAASVKVGVVVALINSCSAQTTNLALHVHSNSQGWPIAGIIVAHWKARGKHHPHHGLLAIQQAPVPCSHCRQKMTSCAWQSTLRAVVSLSWRLTHGSMHHKLREPSSCMLRCAGTAAQALLSTGVVRDTSVCVRSSAHDDSNL